MLPNDDLAKWGEPPTDEGELALAELLHSVMQNAEWRMQNEQTPDPAPSSDILHSPFSILHSELEVCRWLNEMMATVVERSGVFESPTPVELRLGVSRLVAGAWQAIASTHARPCVVRDLRRVPDDPDRVTPRTGERVRVEAACDRAGHLLVFNVGPRGGVNLLFPQGPDETGVVRDGETVLLADVELTPPAGRERVYAVWSRVPLPRQGAQLRDMRRVEECLGKLRAEDWHAVLLELDHAGP